VREGGEESEGFVARPFVLLVKVGWWQGKALVSAEGTVLGSGVLGSAAGGRGGHWGWFCVRTKCRQRRKGRVLGKAAMWVLGPN